mmetsp:Transcript_1882/g.7560  ORF Transcript_1882/g.7560 Transcript_1882/m.7560 type:complete len:239 (-) Transcript_1882:2988-3704(-)
MSRGQGVRGAARAQPLSRLGEHRRGRGGGRHRLGIRRGGRRAAGEAGQWAQVYVLARTAGGAARPGEGARPGALRGRPGRPAHVHQAVGSAGGAALPALPVGGRLWRRRRAAAAAAPHGLAHRRGKVQLQEAAGLCGGRVLVAGPVGEGRLPVGATGLAQTRASRGCRGVRARGNGWRPPAGAARGRAHSRAGARNSHCFSSVATARWWPKPGRLRAVRHLQQATARAGAGRVGVRAH